MNEEFYISALIDELSGQLSHEDQVQLNHWRSTNPESDQLEKNIRDIWEESQSYKHDLTIDVEQDWKILERKINAEKSRSIPTIWYRIAAIFVLSISISVLIFQKKSIVHFEATKDNQEIVLSDGTILSLSKGSELSYPKNFGIERSIEISGQALLKVAKDEKKSFVLTTPDMEIRVLGTTFFISDFTQDQKGEIQLIEGKISLKTMEDKDKSIVLTEGQRISISASGTTLSDKLNTQVYPWYPEDFDFKNESLSSVIKKVSDFYGINITLEANLYPCTFTGNLNNLSAEEIIKSISKVYSAQLNQEAGSYVIVGGSCQ
jgi:ferric-dicitrate binding protein FerR (iron transport regulator)